MRTQTVEFFYPDWPAPERVRALTTTRLGGVSQPPFASFNLADHVGDDPKSVVSNRAHLMKLANLPSEPVWLRQEHGLDVTVLGDRCSDSPAADACVAQESGKVCAVMTADCLPVLLCDRAGTQVAAAHAGWRGLAAGVLEATVATLDANPAQLLAWLGPAIGPRAFEVGDEVREIFLATDAAASAAFSPAPAKQGRAHWLADLYLLARQRLARVGVTEIYGGGYCTYTDQQRFYSYRRDGRTGRMASLIWLDDK